MRYCGGHRFFLVIGMDSLADLPNWYRASDLLTLVDLIVVNRDQAQNADIEHFVSRLPLDYQPLAGKEQAWQTESGRSLQVLMDFDMPYSSTAIRQALRLGEEPAGLPEAVAAYIHAHQLYRSPS